ncbi:MAG TPA: type II toxin-antitoxin system HicB family antitoxin [Candidatus Binatia bacterium]|jgi:predicted RNase H-like HicB family nuclease|nr:type II toxin-antitoxin system HicB family antitoxin [Candidatus Binatia bacterium]
MATYLEYIKTAMRHAQYEQMEDGRWFASIPGFDGLWADGSSREEAQQQLSEALDGWIYVHALRGQNRPPVIGGADLLELPKRIEHD